MNDDRNVTMGPRITDDDRAAWAARYGGVSAERAAARALGERTRVPGKKRLGDSYVDDENAEQTRLVELLALEPVRVCCPDLRFFHHVPNGDDRPKRTAGRLAAAGVVSGALDLRWDLRRPFPRWTGDERLAIDNVRRLKGPRPPVLVRSLDRFDVASGLVVELKAGDGQPSLKQAEWLVWLADQAFACFVAWTAFDAFNVTMLYGGLPFRIDDGRVRRLP